MKRYSAFPKAPALLVPHNQIIQRHIKDSCLVGVDLTPLQRSSWCILQPQPTGQKLLYISDRKLSITNTSRFPYLPAKLPVFLLNYDRGKMNIFWTESCLLPILKNNPKIIIIVIFIII